MLTDRNIKAIEKYKELQSEFKKGLNILSNGANTLPSYMIIELLDNLNGRLQGIEGTVFEIINNLHIHK